MIANNLSAMSVCIGTAHKITIDGFGACFGQLNNFFLIYLLAVEGINSTMFYFNEDGNFHEDSETRSSLECITSLMFSFLSEITMKLNNNIHQNMATVITLKLHSDVFQRPEFGSSNILKLYYDIY